jgi:hypothetical protein
MEEADKNVIDFSKSTEGNGKEKEKREKLRGSRERVCCCSPAWKDQTCGHAPPDF